MTISEFLKMLAVAGVQAVTVLEKATWNGKADLVGGTVPAAQLPSYVDDVLEYASLAAFPVTGESNKIYVAIDTSLPYRWGGSAYVALNPSLALGETSSTAYRGDRGKSAYDHFLTTHGTASALDVGTTANKVVQLNGDGKLPAVDGSLLTGISVVGAEVATNKVISVSGSSTDTQYPSAKLFYDRLAAVSAAMLTLSKVDMDLMEYATDAAAQTAYVSNGMANVSASASSADAVNGSSVVLGTLRDGITGVVGAFSTTNAPWSIGYSFPSAQSIYKIRWYNQANGERNKHFLIEYSVDGSTNWMKAPITGWADGSTQSSVDEAEAANANGWNTVTFAPVSAKAFRIAVTNFWDIGDDNAGVTEIEMYSASIAAYGQAVIKTEGSYALKVVATTGGINKTLTRTVSPTLNLSNKTTIKFDVRASRTGSQFKLGIHDSGGTTTEITPNIAEANVWQTVTWDISEVSNANKDTIDLIVITVLNADSENIIYIDNMYAYIAP